MSVKRHRPQQNVQLQLQNLQFLNSKHEARRNQCATFQDDVESCLHILQVPLGVGSICFFCVAASHFLHLFDLLERCLVGNHKRCSDGPSQVLPELGLVIFTDGYRCFLYFVRKGFIV